MILQKGTLAPNFKLKGTLNAEVELNKLKGKNVILAFYPFDWALVCSDQMALYNQTLKFFEKHNAVMIGISVDSIWCHAAFSESRNLHFPLLSDFEPKGAIAKLYGAYDEQIGTCKRALFVIDEMGEIAWSFESPMGINPGADGILDALETLTMNHK